MYLQCFCLAASLRFSLIYFWHTISPYGLSKCWPRCVVLVLSFCTKQFMTTFWTNINPCQKKWHSYFKDDCYTDTCIFAYLDFGEHKHMVHCTFKVPMRSHPSIPNHPSPFHFPLSFPASPSPPPSFTGSIYRPVVLRLLPNRTETLATQAKIIIETITREVRLTVSFSLYDHQVFHFLSSL